MPQYVTHHGACMHSHEVVCIRVHAMPCHSMHEKSLHVGHHGHACAAWRQQQLRQGRQRQLQRQMPCMAPSRPALALLEALMTCQTQNLSSRCLHRMHACHTLAWQNLQHASSSSCRAWHCRNIRPAGSGLSGGSHHVVAWFMLHFGCDRLSFEIMSVCDYDVCCS